MNKILSQIRKYSATALLLFLILLLKTGCKEIQEDQSSQPIPELELIAGDSLHRKANLEELSKDFEISQIELFDPHFNQIKKYRAFNFNHILKDLFQVNSDNESWSAVSFTSLDGFNAIIEKYYFLESEAYLVIGGVESENWEPIPDHGDVTAAPFYLVWTHPEKIPKNGFPWPWQIKSLELVQTKNRLSALVPDKELVSPDTFSGYELFKSRCSVCHAISGEGGKIGPDLNEPMNVLQYRSEKIVKAFIKESSSFRNGKMPDFKDLSDLQIQQLIDYLVFLKGQHGDESNNL